MNYKQCKSVLIRVFFIMLDALSVVKFILSRLAPSFLLQKNVDS